ncbi:MAG: hypothetical protein ACKO5K_09945, partial [Armatimonadota bacterium]
RDMHLSSVANTLVVAWYFLAGIIALAGLLLLAKALSGIERRLSDLERTLAPMVAKADALLAEGEQRARSVADHTEAIFAATERTAQTIDTTTTETSRVVQGAIYRPFVELNAVLSGITAGGVHMLASLLRSGKAATK